MLLLAVETAVKGEDAINERTKRDGRLQKTTSDNTSFLKPNWRSVVPAGQNLKRIDCAAAESVD